MNVFQGKLESLKESHASVDNRFDSIKFDWMNLHGSNIVCEIFVDEIAIVRAFVIYFFLRFNVAIFK